MCTGSTARLSDGRVEFSNHKRYRFTDILIDEDQRVVVVEGQEAEVQPQVFDLLIYLIQNHDRAVSKQELQDQIWPGIFVSETVLSRTVMKARKAVGDDARNQLVIKTLHGHGYRFVAQLEADESVVPESSRPASTGQESVEPVKRTRPWRFNRVWALLVLALLVMVSYLIGSKFFGETPKLDREPVAGVSIAVLPFTNLSDDKNSEYFSDGLSEEIMNRLARVSGLQVVARTSAFSFKGSQKKSRRIANELRVSHLIDGSVRKDGDQLRVNAQLIDSSGYQIWSKTYTGELVDVFTLQDTIANDIVSQVRPSLPVDTQENPIATVPPTRNLEAYELVLRGNFHLQRRNEGPLKRSIGLFEEAISLDKRYGDAYVGLATAYALLPSYSYETQEESFSSAMATIEKGAQFDSSVPIKASGIKSFMLYNSQWSWIDSENGFRQALDYAPDNADALQWYSLFLSGTGRFEDSLRVAEHAQQLDPLSPVVNHRLAIAHLWANNDDEALRYFERARELGMPSASIPGAYIILMLRNGEYEKPRQVLAGVQRMLGLGSYWLDAFFGALEDPMLVPSAVAAVEKAAENGDIPRLYLYPIWTYLQQDDRALDAAFKLVQDPSKKFNTEFLFSRESAVLRANPRFAQLVQTIGLRRYWEEFEWPDMCQQAGESIVCN